MMGQPLAKAFFLTLATFFSLTACTRQSARRSTRELRLALGAEPPVLDPQLADTGVSVFILRQVVSTLFDYDADNRIVAQDAAEHHWSKDGRELSVKVRADLKWSDGVPVKACQYRDGILRALDPQVPSALSEILYEIVGAKKRKLEKGPEAGVGIICDDAANTLTVKAARPFSPKILHGLAFVVAAPIRKDVVASRGPEWLLPQKGQPGLSTGAFQISEWSHDRRVRLVARTEPHLPSDRKARLEAIDLPLVKDPTTALAMYESGDLDMLQEIPPALLPKLKNRADRVQSPYFTTYMVGFSFDANPALKDARLRQALVFSANQEEVPKLLGEGGESAARGWIPPLLLPPAYRPVTPLFDPQKARSLLKAAGYGPQGKALPRLKLFYNGGERHSLLMERLAHNWKEHLGLDVELDPIEWKVLVAKIKAQAPDLYRYAWAAVYPDPVFFLELYQSQSLNNFGHWKNARFDRLVDELSGVPLEKRDDAFYAKITEAQNILVREDPALIPIYHYVRNALVKPNVKGLVFTGQGLGALSQVSKD